MDICNLRSYGKEPYSTAVIHGGPGAAGDIKVLAEELSKQSGILEPLQTRDTIEGQLLELYDILIKKDNIPITLIGHSWGAFLSFLFAGRYPSMVVKLILVSSPPFEEKYVPYYKMMRLRKLTENEREEVKKIEQQLASDNAGSLNGIFERFGELMSRSDSYDPIPHENTVLEFRADINKKVWAEAKALRKSGELLSIGKLIRCPVIAIHGENDPHPYEGVRDPLSGIIKSFRFILLEKCGHYPWYEKHARNSFYKIIFEELKQGEKIG